MGDTLEELSKSTFMVPLDKRYDATTYYSNVSGSFR